ncbi:MAG: HNH endonuclease [Olivibacter sp.]|nr:HNH endonuclease [Olivibacter sp. UJ_SKK_5.1]
MAQKYIGKTALSQIKDRIKTNSGIHNSAPPVSPNRYNSKQAKRLWVLKSVDEPQRASKTIDSYNDSLSEYYNYDSLVANSKQISEGDIAILVDKEKVLGFAHIGDINISDGQKTIRRCPECPSTTIDTRKTKTPIYRCNKGHEFDKPIEKLRAVKKYKAAFDHFINLNQNTNSFRQLRDFYINGYNQNMSMQLLDMRVLHLFPEIKKDLLNLGYLAEGTTLSSNEALSKEDEAAYLHSEIDDRESVFRSIKARRGQQKFRESLCKRYNNTCVVTGCKILDILEAAHIMPYRGKKDNHPSNGLLLRADIHTLFDLNLIAIDPKNLRVHFHRKVLKEYGEFHLNKILVESHNQPNAKCLSWRWNIYTTTL